jgi:hypothetical protein
MIATAEMLDGTLNPDGTIVLDHKPGLPPGRVSIVLQPVQAPPARRRLVDVIDEIRQAQQTRPFQPRSAQEIDGGLREGDDEYERKLQTARTAAPPALP